MANYVVTTKTYEGDYDTIIASMETYIETIDTTKTIIRYDIYPRGSEFVGIIVHLT